MKLDGAKVTKETKEVKINDLVLFEDILKVRHIAKVVSRNNNNSDNGNNSNNIGVIVIKSLGKSNLNSSLISLDDIIIKFEGCKNDLEVEKKYPEIWI